MLTIRKKGGEDHKSKLKRNPTRQGPATKGHSLSN